jgi:hypothetical protein
MSNVRAHRTSLAISKGKTNRVFAFKIRPWQARRVMDIVATINHSISLVGRLREISKNLSEIEFKNLLADLSGELADAKLQIAELKHQLAAQAEEIQSLKTAAPENKQKPTIQWGCYKFEREEGLFCSACYDSKGKKSLINRLNSSRRSCPVCNAVIGT